ncbi:pseudouridine kinase [Cryptomeria japonica]|uniref:pseudouridine kinase n=1 Tax=Cryptomeria japonica TaxID=3369 RepID=UPI0027DA8281|nr:pseudouridine kinase [Cryptomeria japonica]
MRVQITNFLTFGGSSTTDVRYVRGGVARNVAECVSKLGVKPFIISVVGQDLAGNSLLDHWKSLGLPILGIHRCNNIATPIVSNIFDSEGELSAAVADVEAVEKALTAEWINQFSSYIGSAPLLMVDANLHPLALEAACNLAKESNTPVWLEPVSVAKSVRARSILKNVTFISPNEAELIAMAEAVSFVDLSNSLKALEEHKNKMSIEAVYGLFKPAISILLEEGVRFITLTLGSYGVLLCFKEISSFQRIPTTFSEFNQFTDFDLVGLRERNELLLSSSQNPVASNNFYVKCQKLGHNGIHLNCVHFPALPVSVLSLTGAGDCFVGGTLAALCGGRDIIGSIAFGVAVAKWSVNSELNVPSNFSPKLVSGKNFYVE